jgi:hypothetical protein
VRGKPAVDGTNDSPFLVCVLIGVSRALYTLAAVELLRHSRQHSVILGGPGLFPLMKIRWSRLDAIAGGCPELFPWPWRAVCDDFAVTRI